MYSVSNLIQHLPFMKRYHYDIIMQDPVFVLIVNLPVRGLILKTLLYLFVFLSVSLYHLNHVFTNTHDTLNSGYIYCTIYLPSFKLPEFFMRA